MSQSHFSLMWEAYKSNICTGFSSLQHNGEFVDMTLAADGYIVKVHQVLMALSSPYIKELIASAPCPHPVIYLNNVSHTTLCLILEYVYTGEVLVPSKNFTSFIEAGKALHIKGLQQMELDATEECNPSVVLVDDTIKTLKRKSSTNDMEPDATEECIPSVVLIDDNIKRLKRKSNTDEKIRLPTVAQRMCLKTNSDPLSQIIKSVTNVTHINDDDNDNYSDNMCDADISEVNEEIDNNDQDKCNTVSEIIYYDKSRLQYTLSIRGFLQVIFNRFIYNSSYTNAVYERRWRCIDYRRKDSNKCKAFIITQNNKVKKRVNMHNHAYHDKKILAKIKNNSVFSKIEDIKSIQLRESKMDRSQEWTETPNKPDVTKLKNMVV